jgi:hypothetical protein
MVLQRLEFVGARGAAIKIVRFKIRAAGRHAIEG